jgi:hypothetical protein
MAKSDAQAVDTSLLFDLRVPSRQRREEGEEEVRMDLLGPMNQSSEGGRLEESVI